MKYADVSSSSNPSEVLRFSPNGAAVRVTVAFYDPFDGDFDKETLIGDFDLERLKAGLATLDTATGPVPIPTPVAQARQEKPVKIFTEPVESKMRSRWFR